MTYSIIYDSPIGILLISATDTAIFGVDFANQIIKDNPNDLCREAVVQLQEYFNGTRKVFDLPVSYEGTDFQRKVWAQLKRIPYGELRTYQQIAITIGNPRGYRAVGMACNRNPIAIITPCHRIVGAKGLTGYAGGLDKKEYLIQLERR